MTPERTPDGRFLVIGKRRWRASDPAIPETFRAELVSELMAARRAVRADGDRARPRVQDAKIALGERGRPWWEPSTPRSFAGRVAATVRALLRARAAASSICPSDVARAAGGPAWRGSMADVRAVIAELRDAGVVRVTQGEKEVDPETARGPVRIRRGARFGS